MWGEGKFLCLNIEVDILGYDNDLRYTGLEGAVKLCC